MHARRAVVSATAAFVLAATAARAAPSPAQARGPVTEATPMASPAGGMAAGPRPNGTGVLPDGRFVTPYGRSFPVGLQPENAVLSADGRRLYVTSEGFDDETASAVPHDNSPHRRFLTVIDTATQQSSRVEDDALHYGVAETRDGTTLYLSEGQAGAVGVYRRTPPAGDPGAPGSYAKVASIVLDPAAHADYPWGLALSPDERRLFVVGFETDTLSVVDLASRSVVGRVATGAYPYGVVVSADGRRAYVTNWGMYNQDVDAVAGARHLPLAVPPTAIGGYNADRSSSVWTYDLTASTPSVVARTRIGADLNGDDVVGGSLPSGLALSPDGRDLAVTSSNHDLVELLDVTRASPDPAHGVAAAHARRVVDLRVIPGGPTGAQPDAVAWLPGTSRLLVAEGGRNSVAVIDARRVGDGTEQPGSEVAAGRNASAVLGRVPTGWYPTAVTPSADGRTVWVTSNMGLGSGPNLGPGAGNNAAGASAATYIPDTLRGTVQRIDWRAAGRDLARLSAISDRDNGLVPASTGRRTVLGDGSVVPVAFGRGPSPVVKHVFLIIKENRSFDQILGDLPGVERSQGLTEYGEFVTPNTHALARRFSLGDNFYANSETSVDGHYGIDTGQINEFVLKTTPSSYAGKFTYDHFQTSPENLPKGGFIWDNAARHGVVTRVFGEGTYVVGLGPEQLGKGLDVGPSGLLQPGVRAATVTYDPTYPSQVNIQGSVPTSQGVALANTVFPFNDEGRVASFARSMRAFSAAGTMPQLNVLLLFDDHTDGYLPGHDTPEDKIAENDHALGEIVEMISRSPFWRDSAIFTAEDDTQGGQDHVDAHRTYGLVISPWTRPGHVTHVHSGFTSMLKTIDLILGLPPTSVQELSASSMADAFIDATRRPDLSPYSARPNNTWPETNPSPLAAPNPLARAAAELALRIPPGIDRGGALLPADIELGRAGAIRAGDPNVVVLPAASEHTLADGSPEPLGDPAPGP